MAGGLESLGSRFAPNKAANKIQAIPSPQTTYLMGMRPQAPPMTGQGSMASGSAAGLVKATTPNTGRIVQS